MNQHHGSADDPLRQAAVVIRRLKERLVPLEQAEQDRTEPIAVIGMGCRFPGSADSVDTFWELLDAGRDAVGPLDQRWALVGDHPSEDVPHWAGLLTQPVDGFDAAFFGISPR
jgi:epothilone polyketide synthase D